MLLKHESVVKRIFVFMQLAPSSREFVDRVESHPGAILHGRGYASCHSVVTLMENSGLHFREAVVTIEAKNGSVLMNRKRNWC
jgi:hypothetical protein